MKIYFAAPLFNDAERHFNLELTMQLETKGFDVFLPQRDGAEKDNPPYDIMNKEQRRKALFSLDRDQILNSEMQS